MSTGWHHSSRFGSGNFTRGSDRKGYRGGRKPAYPEGTITRIQRIRLSEAHVAAATLFGRGNAARGIRLALTAAALRMPGMPTDEIRARALFLRENRNAPHTKQALGVTAAARKSLGVDDEVDEEWRLFSTAANKAEAKSQMRSFERACHAPPDPDMPPEPPEDPVYAAECDAADKRQEAELAAEMAEEPDTSWLDGEETSE